MVIKKLFRSNNEAIKILIGLLCFIGILNIYSASYYSSYGGGDGAYYQFAIRQIGAAIFGGILMWVAERVDYRRARAKQLAFYLGILSIFLLICVEIFGETRGGAQRWLQVGIQFQPSEIAKMAAVCLTALYLGPVFDRGGKPEFKSKEFIMVMFMGGLILAQPDMGTAAIVIASSLIIYIIAGISTEQWRILLIGGIISFVCGIGAAAYRFDRILAWYDPWKYAGEQGYQSVQAQMTIGSGGLIGVGFGQGMSKFYYLPEAHTDFAYAMLCQEWGFIGAVFVILLFMAFTYHGVQISLKAKDGYGKFLAFGMTMLISGQALINMMVVTGIGPVTGIPLPFISYGGTAMTINMICVGILLSVGRQQIPKKRKKPMSSSEQEPLEGSAPPELRLVHSDTRR